MTALQFPCTLFTTKNRMDDYGASDMRFGDLTEAQLKSRYLPEYISDRDDPWALTRRSSMDRPQSIFCCNLRGRGEKITIQQCTNILFDEFRDLSHLFSLYGPYKHLIIKMITHFQNGRGIPFRDISLNQALREHILRDHSAENSTRLLLQSALSRNIDWTNNIYPAEKKDELRKAILKGRLPKFNRFQDSINGMGITVHDLWATRITIQSLQVGNGHYRAVVNYKSQDHFGLDTKDISNPKFNQFLFFRIWFVLQHYNVFSFKPFVTDMEAIIEITGSRYEIKH